MSAAIESGHVLLPRNAPWLEEYLNQWTGFPAAAHDDMVDSSSQALSYLFSFSTPEPLTDEEQWRMDEEEAERSAITGEWASSVYGRSGQY